MQVRDRVTQDQDPLTRRDFAVLAMAGLLAAGVASLTVAQASARESEPGDDHGGHGNDDGPGDDHGGRRGRRHGRHHGQHHR
jgi:hypothetical protein